MKKQNLKNKKGIEGITLIALVITIIVLLILSGVSIATLTGENGILTQASTAKQISDRAKVIEQAKIDILAWQTEQMANGKSGELTASKVKEILTGKDYLKDGKLEDEGFKDKDGEIIFEYSDLYNKKESKGKTIAELYDGINNPDDENYNENAMHIGDWVNYTAGTWEETIEEASSVFSFGGYTEGQSRDENANGTNTGARAGATYEGWRIWDISEDKQTITLISAGCPEEYYYSYDGTDSVYICEYILSGNINATANKDALGLGTTYTKRDWSIYKNETQYANSARVLAKGDLDTWYVKYIDDQYTDTYDIPTSFPANNANKLISTVENQCYYWLSPADGDFSVRSVDPDNRFVGDYTRGMFGVRILVSLTSEVKFEETSEEIEKDGFTYNKWIIQSK